MDECGRTLCAGDGTGGLVALLLLIGFVNWLWSSFQERWQQAQALQQQTAKVPDSHLVAAMQALPGFYEAYVTLSPSARQSLDRTIDADLPELALVHARQAKFMPEPPAYQRNHPGRRDAGRRKTGPTGTEDPGLPSALRADCLTAHETSSIAAARRPSPWLGAW